MAVDELTSTFAALADPTRRAIVARLAEGEATVNELAEPFPISVQAVSKHLKVLERAGLITRGRTAQWRPCRLRGRPLGDASGWLSEYREFWEASFDRLDEHLRTIRATDEGGANDE
jgi:DNA-binding transcriptional ArsR family regulator